MRLSKIIANIENTVINAAQTTKRGVSQAWHDARKAARDKQIDRLVRKAQQQMELSFEVLAEMERREKAERKTKAKSKAVTA